MSIKNLVLSLTVLFFNLLTTPSLQAGEFMEHLSEMDGEAAENLRDVCNRFVNDVLADRLCSTVVFKEDYENHSDPECQRLAVSIGTCNKFRPDVRSCCEAFEHFHQESPVDAAKMCQGSRNLLDIMCERIQRKNRMTSPAVLKETIPSVYHWSGDVACVIF